VLNFTNILHTIFSYKSQTSSYSVLKFGLDLFGHKEIGAKIAQKNFGEIDHKGWELFQMLS
jgi:hypothetical protein